MLPSHEVTLKGRNGRIDVFILAVRTGHKGLHDFRRLAIVLHALELQCS